MFLGEVFLAELASSMMEGYLTAASPPSVMASTLAEVGERGPSTGSESRTMEGYLLPVNILLLVIEV